MKKKFSETKVGAFLKENAPSVLDVVDDFVPPVKILTALVKGASIPPEKRAELEKLLAEYEMEELRLEYADRSDARSLQKEALQQEDVFSKRFLYYLTIFSIGLGFTYIFLTTFIPIPQQNLRIVDTTQGFLLGVVLAGIYAFWFGSSNGSHQKTNIITKMKNDIAK